MALTQVRKEDAAELDQFSKNFRAAFNDNAETKSKWGGGKIGIKSTHKVEYNEKQIEKEELKKSGL